MLGTAPPADPNDAGQGHAGDLLEPHPGAQLRDHTSRVSDIAWLISGALCGAAGVALAITTVSFDFSLGGAVPDPDDRCRMLGGIGQPYGAMLGGLIVGVSSEVFAAVSNPNYKDIVAFAILIIVLLVRPRGLFGTGSATRRLMEG